MIVFNYFFALHNVSGTITGTVGVRTRRLNIIKRFHHTIKQLLNFKSPRVKWSAGGV